MSGHGQFSAFPVTDLYPFSVVWRPRNSVSCPRAVASLEWREPTLKANFGLDFTPDLQRSGALRCSFEQYVCGKNGGIFFDVTLPVSICLFLRNGWPFSLVQQDTMETGRYGRRGSPWEFNLRDVFRWCEVMLREQQPPPGSGSDNGSIFAAAGSLSWEPWLLVDSLYIQRMRTRADRGAVLARFRDEFPEAFQGVSQEPPFSDASSDAEGGGIGTHPMVRMTPDWMQVGPTVLPRGCWANPLSRSGGGRGEFAAGLTMPLALRRPLQALARY